MTESAPVMVALIAVKLGLAMNHRVRGRSF